MRFQSLLIPGLIAGAALQMVLVVFPAVPLGIPGEWQWSRHAYVSPWLAAVFQFVPAVVGTTLLLFVARVGNRRFFRQHRRCIRDMPAQRHGPPRTITATLLLALLAASWIWIKTVESCTPAPHRNLKSLWVLYDPSSSGYFFEAAFKIDSTAAFLDSYPERMAEGDVLHVGTHPPGLFLLSRWSINLCRSIPAVTSRLHAWIPRNDLRTFRALEASAGLEQPLSESDVTALFLMSELTTLAAACTVIPLFFLVRRCFDALTAWRTACLWATLPCLVIFLPKSDVLFTFTSMSATALGVTAIASREGLYHRLLLASACGLVLWLGLMMSLAHLPVVALLGAVGFIRCVRVKTMPIGASAGASVSVGQIVAVFVAMAGSMLAATVVFSVTASCNMFSVWQMNLSNHGAFYDEHTRTAWKWLLVNPLELGLSMGLPAAFMALSGLVFAVRQVRAQDQDGFGSLNIDLSIAVGLTVAALWLSCRNSGEAARLWCFLTPWVLALSAHWLWLESRDSGVKNLSPVWHTMLLTQILVCIMTSGRVNGFSF